MQANKTLVQMKCARVVGLFAEASGLSRDEALAFFYDSLTYEEVIEGRGDMHCRADGYLVENLLRELREKVLEQERQETLQAC